MVQPLDKRQEQKQQHSRLFTPYRAIGSITDGAPFGINRLGDATFITTTVGNAFQVFEADKLRLAIVAPPLLEGGNVVGIQAQKSRTFVATERCIQVWDRMTLVKGNLFAAVTNNNTTALPTGSKILAILLLGDVLLGLTSQGKLHIWDSRSLKAVDGGPLSIEGDFRTGGVLVHPDTYLNKVLIGDGSGCLMLWNIRSRKQVHKLVLDGQAAALTAAITALEASPAIDVVAVGRADGTISVINLRYDKVLFNLRQDRVPVTSLSFRTDCSVATQECPMLASGGHDGQVYVWDLKTQRLHSTIGGATGDAGGRGAYSAHQGPVSRVYFFPREPILLSAGKDNAIKMWIFDAADGSARLLKSREGHTAPPRHVRYYGDVTEASMGTGANAEGCQILSAGSDKAFRVFHTARDAQSREMSQGPLLKKAKQLHVKPEDLKLAPILSFAATETRARDWCNVITCHEGDGNAYVWKFDQRALGKVVLRQPEWAGSGQNVMSSPEVPERQALCVGITACGNYGVVGTRGGVVYIYNMQSGEARGAFPKMKSSKSTPHKSMVLARGQARPGSVWAAHKSVMGNGTATTAITKGAAAAAAAKAAAAEARAAAAAEAHAMQQGHQGPVTGVQVDSLNSLLMSSGLDGTLRFWNFKSHALLEVVRVGVGIAQLEQARDSELLAAACDDFVIRVYDTTSRKLVRRLEGHSMHISDLCFSRDGRRLVSASVDATVRVWDLPTGACVDWIRFKRPVTGLTLSHTGEYLCTSHVDRLGLYLWADRSFFQTVDLGRGGPPAAPCDLDEPTALAEIGDVSVLQLQDGEEEETRALRVVEETPAGIVEERGKEEERSRDPMETQPKKAGLITLAMLPRAYWQTLFQLELIKARNKPRAPPKAPLRAPFFLPTMHPDGVNPTFAPPPSAAAATAVADEGEKMTDMGDMAQAWSDEDDNKDGGEEGEDGGASTKYQANTVSSALNAGVLPAGSRILNQGIKDEGRGKPTRSRFGTLLLRAEEEGGVEGDDVVTRHLMSLGPPQVDLEMQALCLGIFDDDGMELLKAVVRYLTRQLASRRHFEVMQAYLSRFLKIYAPLLLEAGAAVRVELDGLREAQRKANRQMKELVQHNLCLLGFFANLKGF